MKFIVKKDTINIESLTAEIKKTLKTIIKDENSTDLIDKIANLTKDAIEYIQQYNDPYIEIYNRKNGNTISSINGSFINKDQISTDILNTIKSIT